MEKSVSIIKTKPVHLGIFILSSILSSYSLSYAAKPTLKDKDGLMPSGFNWSGPYLGGYVGGAWGQSHMSTNAGGITSTSYFASQANINSFEQFGTSTINPNAFIGGVQFYDNFVIHDQYLLGLAIDYGALHLNAAHQANEIAYPDNSGSYSLETSTETDWYYTLRGRLGYIVTSLSTPFLVYTTGGLAVTNPSVSNTMTDTTSLQGVGGAQLTNSNQVGWTLGAGFEFPITSHLTINSEYAYMQFGSVTVNSSIYNSAQGFGIDYQSQVSPFTTTTHLSANLIKMGLNYKFK